MLGVFLSLSLIILSTFGISTYIKFSKWKQNLTTNLHQNSDIARTKNGQIEYKLFGTKGDVVLALHGTPGGYDQFTPNEGALLKNRRLLSISRAGYLRSDITSNKTLKRQAETVVELLDTLQIDSVIIMGASGGGPLALALSAYYPKRTKALILYAALSQPHDLSPVNKGSALFQKLFRWDFTAWVVMGKFPERVLKMLIHDQKLQEQILNDPETLKSFINGVNSILPPSLRNAGQDNDIEIFKSLNIPKKQITSPTLILHGDKDTNVPPEYSNHLHQQIPHSKLVSLEGGDHFSRYSHAKIIDATIQEFLEQAKV